MERRKVQKTGVATYTVSLPKSWILKQNIKPSDELIIYEEEDQSLKISLEDKTEEVKEVSINIKDYKNEIEVIRKFTAHYLNGATKITILSDKAISSAYMKKIILQIKKVIGFEIIEETSNKIVLQDFFTANYLSINKAIRRAFNISKLILEESRKNVIRKGYNLENIGLWEDEINRLYLLVRRQINFAIHNSVILKQLNITLKECQDYLILIGAIEKISDIFVEIANSGTKLGKLSKYTINYLNTSYKNIATAYEMAFRSIFTKDFALSNEALQKIDEIKISTGALKKEKLEEDVKRILYLVIYNLHSTTNFVKEIAEIGLDIC